MQSSLKKSLYLGLAALSFASVAAVSTNASAKSYAKAGAETDLTVSKKDANVESTGTNALFTKPGTTKGAKVVASKAKMKSMANSGKSADYFWAYRTTTTNKGAVYYKVVSMNGKYRGYVYAGRTEGEFNRGLKKADTVTTATNPTKLTGYYLKNVAKNTLWTAPKNTERHAKKVSLYGVGTSDTFNVDKAETKTRENTLYYHVTDSKNAKVSGWIYAGKGYDANATAANQSIGGLSLTQNADAATADNSVKVEYRDADGKTLSNATWIVSNPKVASVVNGAVYAGDSDVAGVKFADFVTNNAPAGYKVSTTSPVVTSATYGQTVYATVAKFATSKVNLKVNSVSNKIVTDGTPAETATEVTPALTAGSNLAASDLTNLKLDTVTNGNPLEGAINGDFDSAALVKALPSAGLDGTKNYTDKDGNYYHYVFTLNADDTNSDNRNAKFGDTVVADFDAVLTAGKVGGTTSTDNGWIAE